MDKNQSKKSGNPPGTLIYTGDKTEETVNITALWYDADKLDELTITDISEIKPKTDGKKVLWLNVSGLADPGIIESICEKFKIHPLIIEDILNVSQRPKTEDFEDYTFIVLKMLEYDKKAEHINGEQVSLLLGRNYIVTFLEKRSDVFEQIKQRLRNSKGKIRMMGAGYLAYALIDSIVDRYFDILESIGEQAEYLEEILIHKADQNILRRIHRLKRNLILIRKSVWPLREVLSILERVEPPVLQDHISIYFRDVYDHIMRIIDSVETYRDMAANMLDIYLSSVSNKMNEVMKILTIIATIFIPLTFITGVYGMNFKYMPELNWSFGYPLIMTIMLLLGIVMFIYFKKKKWW